MSEGTSALAVEGFNRPENSGMAQRTSAAASSNARAELEAMCAMARAHPRDEEKALSSMVTAAKRPAFAEAATYSFPRGKKQLPNGEWADNFVTGPSVSLARPVATYWGHIRFGVRILDDDDDEMGIEGFAHDLQTGAYCTLPDRFKKVVFRKKGGWVKPDERDLRELVMRRGAILVRNCILSVVPPDIVDRVLQECAKTLDGAASGKLAKSRVDTVRDLVLGWADFGISKEDLETFLGHPLDQLTSQELVTFQGMWRSIRDGNTKISDHFERASAKQETSSISIDLSKAREGVASDPAGGKPGAMQKPAAESEASIPKPRWFHDIEITLTDTNGRFLDEKCALGTLAAMTYREAASPADMQVSAEVGRLLDGARKIQAEKGITPVPLQKLAEACRLRKAANGS